MSRKPRWTTVTAEESEEVEKNKTRRSTEKRAENIAIKPRKMVGRRRRPAITPEELEEIEKNIVEIKCAFCKGKGIDPFGLSRLSDCPICHRKRTVKVVKPNEKCKACDGTGVYIRSHLYCWPCRGTGVVSKGSQQ